MRGRSGRHLLIVAVAVASAAAGAGSGSAVAQTSGGSVGDVGWWTTNPTAEAPEGGLAVAAGPNGTVSLGAVRVVLRVDRVDSARLALAEEGGLQASGAQLQVCPTPNAWSAGAKQAMDRAPKPECDRGKVPLARAEDGVWSADVSGLLAAGDDDDVALMVVPAGAGSVPVGFEVRFRPPTVDVQGSSDDDGTFSSSASSPFPASSSEPASVATGGSDDAGEPGAGSPGSFSPSLPSAFSGTSSPSPVPSISGDQLPAPFESTPTAADTAAAGATASTGDSSSVAVAARPILSGGRGSRYGQGLFFVLVSLVVGVAVGFGHARLRPGDDAPG